MLPIDMHGAYVHMGQVNLELWASQPDEIQDIKLKINVIYYLKQIFNTHNQGEFKPENMQGIAPSLM